MKLKILFLFLLFIPSVLSLGLSPAKTTIMFEPDLEKNISINIYKESINENTVTLFSDYEFIMPLEKTLFLNESIVKSKLFVKLPKNLDFKNTSFIESKVFVTENPVLNGGVLAVIKIPHKVFILLPVRFNESVLVDKNNVLFNATIENIGNYNITKMRVLYKIYNTSTSIVSDEFALLKNQEIELLNNISLPKGEYIYNIQLIFDESYFNINGSFNVTHDNKRNLYILNLLYLVLVILLINLARNYYNLFKKKKEVKRDG